MVMKRIAAAFAVSAVLIALWANPASAHNSLVEASPAKDATLTEAPAEVKLRFLATLKPDTLLTVTDAQGASVIGAATIEGKVISAPFTGTAGGTYTVGYELVSADGHPIKKDYTFTLKPAAVEVTVTQSPTPAPPATTEPPAAAAEQEQDTPWLPYIGGAALAGLLVGGIIAYLRRNRA